MLLSAGSFRLPVIREACLHFKPGTDLAAGGASLRPGGREEGGSAGEEQR